jgi:Peptidase C13 family
MNTDLATKRLPMSLRRSVGVIIFLGALWLMLWSAIDWWYSQPDPLFDRGGLPLFAWYALGVLGLAALLAWLSKPKPAFAPALVLSVCVVPVPLLLASVAPEYLDRPWLLAATGAAVIGTAIFLARGLRPLTGKSQFPAAVAGVVFIAGFVYLSDALDAIPSVWVVRESEEPVTSEGLADAETLLFEQAGRIDAALAAVKRDASSRPQAFFLGFAGVGDEKVFAQEIALASGVLGRRYAVNGRSLSLINDQRDLDSAPIASAPALKYALRGLADRMNVDQDVLFLAISSHGSQDPAIAVANSDLPLNDLSDAELADALSESGIKWRVVIISACYAGAFIDSLKNPQTIVITAAAADRTSFGCSNDRDLTYFGEAFYRDALPGARSLREAFDKAKEAIAVRERREHVDASKPQAYFGAELETKLASMRGAP